MLQRSKLDFEHGFQLLHAVYIVETFLSHLLQRKCCFNIVFFDSNRSLCIPAFTNPVNKCKYYLARAAITQHLQAYLKASHAYPQIFSFSSWRSPDFRRLVSEHAPYFFMIHDGTPNDRIDNGVAHDKQDQRSQQCAFRQLILHLIQDGFNVALVNAVEWHDSKVLTWVLENKRVVKADTMTLTNMSRLPVDTVNEGSVPELQELQDYKLSANQILDVIVLKRILLENKVDIPKEQLMRLCTTFLLHRAFQCTLPLSRRRLAAFEAETLPLRFLQLVADHALRILESQDWQMMDKSVIVCDVADFVDGRLFMALYHGHVPLPQGVQDLLQHSLQAFENSASSHELVSATLQSIVSNSAELMVDYQSTEHYEGPLSVLPFSSPVFDKHLESVRLDIDAHAVDDVSPASRKIFREISHWHNAKKLLDPKAKTTMSTWQVSRRARSNQMFMSEMATYAASLTNAIGKSLEPETIIVKSTGVDKLPLTMTSMDAASQKGSCKENIDKPHSAGGKANAKNAQKQARLAQILQSRARRQLLQMKRF